MRKYGYFVDNQWCEPRSGKYFESENPASGRAWALVPDCGEEDVDIAVSSAKRAFYEGVWRRLLPAERGRVLRRIGDTISKNADRLGEVETKDNGKLPKNITPSLKEGAWSVDAFHYYAGMCDKFEGQLIPIEARNIHNYLKWEPYGVVGFVLPWNSPLGVLVNKLAPCLAAGNTVVMKPSEHASCSILELMDILLDVGLPPGVVNVVTGFGATVGEPLVNHDDIRMVSFTGGTDGGKAAAVTASKKVKPMVMELGGKSPQIIFPDADLKLSVNGVASGIFPAAGQSCISGSRVLVHKSVEAEFTKNLVAISGRAKVGDPLDPSTQIGPISNRTHYERVLEKIKEAELAGHELLLDGRSACRKNGYFIGPTIFKGVPNDSELAQNEIFGPVLSIENWETEEEVIQIANSSIFGLAAGLWTRDVALAIRIADDIEAGTVYINNYFNAATQSPVGGYKQSGYGRESGWEGMRSFMQAKSVWLSTKPEQNDPF